MFHSSNDSDIQVLVGWMQATKTHPTHTITKVESDYLYGRIIPHTHTNPWSITQKPHQIWCAPEI